MLGTDQDEQIIEAGFAEEARPACTALVPLAEPVRWSNRLPRRLLPDPTFVTQLIATSEHDPQAQSLWRANLSDALLAYRPAAKIADAGLRTRQTI
jgi:hypothetical protein